MVFLSESSIREMVQEALGGGGYPTLDGDGNFPIVPSPLAEPIVTKLALQPVRVMRVPTDRQEFELAMKELVDGVEKDHIPTLFLKLRDLVSDFKPKCTSTCPKAEDMAQDKFDREMEAVHESIRSIVRSIIAEADDEDVETDDEIVARLHKQWPPIRRPEPEKKRGAWGQPLSDEPEEPEWDDEDSDSPPGDYDVGAAEDDPTIEEYPPEYLADPGYPPIGEDPDLDTWEDFEKELSKSAWEPGAELDKFRGRTTDDDWDKVADAVQKAASEPDKKKEAEAVGGVMSWQDIAKTLGIGVGTAHGDAAIGARKLAYISEYMDRESFDDFYEEMTDKFIRYLLATGMEKDSNTNKPHLNMEDRLDLQSAIAFEKNEKGKWVEKTMEPEGKAARKAIQELDSFREFLNVALEIEMDRVDYPWRHQDAAKDKDAFSVFHRMKRTTR